MKTTATRMTLSQKNKRLRRRLRYVYQYLWDVAPLLDGRDGEGCGSVLKLMRKTLKETVDKRRTSPT